MIFTLLKFANTALYLKKRIDKFQQKMPNLLGIYIET